MYIDRPRELLKPCIIKPMDDKEGLIVCIKSDVCNSMILVRYFDFSGIRHDWFFDFEIEIKERNKGTEFFKEY